MAVHFTTRAPQLVLDICWIFEESSNMKKHLFSVFLAALFITHAPLSVADQGTNLYRVAVIYPISGVEKWDYLTLDATRHHLFVSRSDHVQVLDSQTGKTVGDIPNTLGVHGIAIDQEDGLGFTSNGKAQNVTVFQLDDLKIIAQVQVTGEDPDAILYLPELKQVYTFNGDGRNITVIDALSHTVSKTITVGATPEFGVSDHQGHVYFNIEQLHQIGMIDTHTATLLHHWNLPNCVGPTGLALDEQTHFLFSSCQNHRLVVTNAITGVHVSALLIGEHPDGVIFNTNTHQILVSNADGTLTVIQQYSPSHYRVVQNVATRPRAKTMTYDSRTQKVYLLGDNKVNIPLNHLIKPDALSDMHSVCLLILAPSSKP